MPTAVAGYSSAGYAGSCAVRIFEIQGNDRTRQSDVSYFMQAGEKLIIKSAPRKSLKTSAYYTKDVGTWGGRGADILGLRDGVNRKDFVSLADN
jgi:hypothetical protein